MKILDIAFKDLKQSFRSWFALAFMFGVPILTTVMFVFLFGGLDGGDEGETNLPRTLVQVVNLDTGEIGLGTNLVDLLQGEQLADLLVTVEAEDAASARQAVDTQQAHVAVIIPENFSEAVTQPGETAAVEIYQDPTLTLGPGIVTAIVEGFTNAFSGSKIAVGVTFEQLAQTGQALFPTQISAIASEYAQGVGDVGGEVGLFAVENTEGESEPISSITGVIRLIMAAMMIFYAFFTGANTVMSVLREEERGTLPRLFTTPTKQSEILTGKFLSSVITVFIQVVVLLIFGAVVFDFNWGDPWLVLLVALGITTSASAFGVLVVSLMTSTKQGGFVMGVGLTVTGMLGMLRVFTQMSPGGATGMNSLSLLVPQGWALQAIQISAEGGSLNALLGSLLALAAWSAACFIFGNIRFKRRYA